MAPVHMAGNVWEWVNDWFARDYYESSPESNQADDAERAFLAALSLADERGLIPVELYALTGLASLESCQHASPGTLELVLYILRHPSCAQETKNWATRLQRELESKLPQGEIEGAHENIETKSLEEFVDSFLVSIKLQSRTCICASTSLLKACSLVSVADLIG